MTFLKLFSELIYLVYFLNYTGFFCNRWEKSYCRCKNFIPLCRFIQTSQSFSVVRQKMLNNSDAFAGGDPNSVHTFIRRPKISLLSLKMVELGWFPIVFDVLKTIMTMRKRYGPEICHCAAVESGVSFTVWTNEAKFVNIASYHSYAHFTII